MAICAYVQSQIGQAINVHIHVCNIKENLGDQRSRMRVPIRPEAVEAIEAIEAIEGIAAIEAIEV